MSQSYSQSKALWAITRASFKAIFAQPISIVFSLLFPIIFILIFGVFGGGGISTQQIAIRSGTDTVNAVFDSLKANKFISLSTYTDTAAMRDELVKGKLTGILFIQPTPDTAGKKKYIVNVQSSSASGTVFPQWLQNICYFLPLTQFNNAMRKISFEGLHLHDTWKEIGILGIWIVIIYSIVAKVIRWE